MAEFSDLMDEYKERFGESPNVFALGPKKEAERTLRKAIDDNKPIPEPPPDVKV